ncbi:hypothetical protein JCM19237_110 [Photobacterium aphoticum]|uniref:Uncharacterized protein n=1 Tax=Photobacterium aphoticum TaxID=754436 RepID=A0A090R296_9GAMM|nr:hypothetical protein JCM19237_110 [Photobacterium aphoticum]
MRDFSFRFVTLSALISLAMNAPLQAKTLWLNMDGEPVTSQQEATYALKGSAAEHSGKRLFSGQDNSDGQLEGLVRFYDKNGILTEEKQYIAGEAKGSYKTFHPNGQIHIESQLLEGERNGITRYYDKHGVLKEHHHLIHGKFDGEQLVYYSDGTVKFRANFVNGLREGKQTRYYKTGIPYSVAHYENGLLNGEQIHYADNGVTSSIIVYKDDKYHGPMRFFTEQGHLKNEKIYVNGRQHGIETSYYDSGQLYGIYPYKDGKAVGVVKMFHPDGKSIKQLKELDDESRTLRAQYFDLKGNKVEEYTANYANDNVVTETRIFTDNVLTSHKKDDKHRQWSLKEHFDSRGTLTGREERLNDKRQGLYLSTLTQYGKTRTTRIEYTNGIRNGVYQVTESGTHYGKEGHYRNDKRVGDWRIVNKDGTHDIQYNAQGERNGKEQRITPAGKLSLLSYYRNGQRHGQHEKYDDGGKVLEKGEYRNNQRHGPWQYRDKNTYHIMMWQGEYQDGKKIGEWKGLSEHGYETEIERYNEEGLKEGVSYSFSQNGELQFVKNYKDGLPHGKLTHYSDGKVYSIQSFEYGEMVSKEKPLGGS